ncbi:MAG: GntR family transcriptional regulator [Oscillospiraceae bacterium]
MFHINFKSGEAIYLQLKEQVINLACQGVLQPNEQLPSVRILARDLGINPNTVSKAYQELENEKVIYSIVGKGSFMTDDILSVRSIQKDIQNSFLKLSQKAKQIGVLQSELMEILLSVYQTQRGENHD